MERLYSTFFLGGASKGDTKDDRVGSKSTIRQTYVDKNKELSDNYSKIIKAYARNLGLDDSLEEDEKNNTNSENK